PRHGGPGRAPRGGRLRQLDAGRGAAAGARLPRPAAGRGRPRGAGVQPGQAAPVRPIEQRAAGLIAGSEPMAGPLRGVYVILCSPFDARGALDEDDLRSEVEFCARAGAHGVVGPANASEFWTLSDAERLRFARVVVEAAAGRVATVIGVTAGSAPAAVALAREAEQAGATAVMAMPPYARPVP